MARSLLALVAVGVVAAGTGCGDSSSPSDTGADRPAPATTQAAAAPPKAATRDQAILDAAGAFWGGVGKGQDATVRRYATARCQTRALGLAKASRAAAAGIPADKLRALGQPSSYVTRGRSARYVEVAQISDSAASWTRWRLIGQRWQWDGCKGGDGPPASARPHPVKTKAKVEVSGLTVRVLRVRFTKVAGTTRHKVAITLQVHNAAPRPLPAEQLGGVLKLAVVEHAASSAVTLDRQVCFGDTDAAFDAYGLWCAQNTLLTIAPGAPVIQPGKKASITLSGQDPSTTHKVSDLLLRFSNTPLTLPKPA